MVIKNLKVALTASQRRRIKSAWRKHGKDGFAILCQVPLYYGPLAYAPISTHIDAAALADRALAQFKTRFRRK